MAYNFIEDVEYCMSVFVLGVVVDRNQGEEDPLSCLTPF